MLIAEDSLVSFVFALNEKPRIDIFFADIVPKSFSMIILEILCCCQLLIFKTPSQQFATLEIPYCFDKQTKFRISFLKQLPPKPGPEIKNFLPIRLSKPIALATSFISAPVASHRALMELIELIR